MLNVWPQWWKAAGGPRDKRWDLGPWYGQFEVGWSQPLQLWLNAEISLVAPGLVSRGLGHAQLHRTWFEPTAECRSRPVASNLCSGHLPVGLFLGRGSLLLVSPLSHFPKCHSGLESSRTEQVCLCYSITRAGSWYGKSKPLYRGGLGPCGVIVQC